MQATVDPPTAATLHPTADSFARAAVMRVLYEEEARPMHATASAPAALALHTEAHRVASLALIEE